MPKSILVTGSNGFIGRHLVKRLIELKYDVVGLDNFSNSLKSTEFETYSLDVSKPDFVEKVLEMLIDKDLAGIYHFGSPCSVIQFNENFKDSVNSTINGFANVLEIAKRKKCKVIYPSSGNIYGDIPIPQSEFKTPRPNNAYALCKLYCEYMTKDWNSMGLRIFAGYGPGEELKGRLSSVVGIFLNQILKGESPVIFGNGEQARDFVYIDDIIDILVISMGIEGSNVVNVGTGVSYTFNQLVETINKVAGTDVKPIYVEKPSSYVENTCADTIRMKRIFNIKPIDLEAGIKKYIEYIFKNTT